MLLMLVNKSFRCLKTENVPKNHNSRNRCTADSFCSITVECQECGNKIYIRYEACF